MSRSPQQSQAPIPLPDWMRWLGAGLTAMVAVLFVVLALQVRQQNSRLQTLQDKLQTLENANDLERTNALEEQLRSTVQRLQSLEGIDNSLQQLSREQESLRQQLRSGVGYEPQLPLDSSLSPSPKPSKPRISRPPALPQLPLNQE